MSRPSLRWLSTVALATSATAGAQDIRRQEQIVDSIAVVQRQTSARVRAHDDSVAAARAAMDTMTIGMLRLVVQPGNAELARTAARMAMDSLRPLGDSVLALLGRSRMVIRRTQAPQWARRPIEPVLVALIDSNSVEQRPMWDAEGRAERVASYLKEQALGIVTARVDPPFARWLGGANGVSSLRFDTVPADGWSQLRLDLVSSPSIVARQCYGGELPACRKVLGLDSIGRPALELYDAAGRRFVADRNAVLFRRLDVATTDACMNGDDASCLRLLERASFDLPFTGIGHRIALVRLAVQHGGPDAAVPLFTSGDDPAPRLAAMARMPEDSLVRLWQTRISSVRAPSDNMTRGMALSSIGWIGLLVFLSSRSRRWR